MITAKALRSLLIVSICLAPGVELAAADGIEQQLVDYVDAHQEKALALLERTVNINSGTLNFPGVREVGRIYAAELERLGFETRWVDGSGFERAGHLVAQWEGGREGNPDLPYLLLIGHLDTVFEPDSPFQRFERISETAAHGPGVTDMKGGDVVMISALAALAAAGVLDDLRLAVVMTGDEEKSGRPLSLARQALIEAAEGADAAIGFEDGDGDPETAVISRRGASGWRLTVTGVPAHSSQIFTKEIGAGAIYEASRILTSFYEELSGEPDLTFNPGTILGGTDVEFDGEQSRGSAFGKTNVVAERAVVAGDLRALSLEQYERAKAKMQAMVAAHLPMTEAEISFSDGYPPLAPSPGNRRLLALYDQVSRDLGFGPVTAVDPRRAGAADVSFVVSHVPQILDGIGLMGTGGHTLDETADLTTLPMQTKRAAVLLYRLSRILRDAPRSN